MSQSGAEPTTASDAEVRYRALFETMGPAVLLMRGPACVDCNPATLALFGVERREEMIGKTPLDFAPEFQPNGESSAALVERNVRLALERGTHTFEWSSRRRNGEPFTMEVRFTPCGPPEEGLFLCIAVDLTDRRLTEAERLRAQKLEAMGILAGGIAHDFNNLLQGISSNLSAALLAGTLDETRALLAEAEESVQVASRLTGQLLTFARGGAPVRRPVDLAPLLQRALRVARHVEHVSVELQLAPGLWKVESDQGQLEQVFHNLVLNATQALGGGGTLQVSARNVEYTRPIAPDQAPAPFVAVSVRDTGVGIRAESLSHIFDPYFSTRPGGTGLGLSTAYSVVSRHGGHIDVQSKVGEGSTFTVYLPASPAPPAETAAPAPAPGEKVPTRLLWMDDEPRLRTVNARLLKLLGHDIETAADGAEAIDRYVAARAAGRPFDLVVLDLTVHEGMGGLEALGRLRALDPGVRAVVCSGYSDDAALAEYRAHGFHGVLRKPCTVEDIERVIAEATAA